MKKNQIAQNIARETMSELHHFIKVGMSEKEIETKAFELMIAKGSTSFWYHGKGALVLLGKRSIESMPGVKYFASEENKVAENDVVTIDLTPTFDGYWGDYARTIFVENGRVAEEDNPQSALFRKGLETEFYLHNKMKEMWTPQMSYEELYFKINEEITALGYENLDVHGNIGHSVNMDEKDRTYIERGSTATFEEIGTAFTLEPHIRLLGGSIAFKRENIYYFDEHWNLHTL